MLWKNHWRCMRVRMQLLGWNSGTTIEDILKFLDDEIQQGRLSEDQIASVAGDISGIGKGRNLSELAVRLAERIERRVLSGDGGDLRREVPERVERLEDGGKQRKEKYIVYIKPNGEEYNKTEKERGVTNEQLRELGIADSADGLTRREAQEILVLANTRGNRRSSRTLSSNLDNESNDIANDTVRSEGLPAGSPDGGEDARLVGKASG